MLGRLIRIYIYIGGDFKYFSFSPRSLGKWSKIWRASFSDGLVQPPTRYSSLPKDTLVGQNSETRPFTKSKQRTVHGRIVHMMSATERGPIRWRTCYRTDRDGKLSETRATVPSAKSLLYMLLERYESPWTSNQNLLPRKQIAVNSFNCTLKTRNPVTIWYTIVSIGRIHGFARFFMDADGKIRSFKFTIISMDPFSGF